MVRRNESITKINKLIGNKVYKLRIASGMSRKKLASEICISNVQLQKYEQGVNSMNANERIILMALAIGQKVSYFFEGLEEAEGAITLNKQQGMCLEVAQNFQKISSPLHREAINNLIKVLANYAA